MSDCQIKCVLVIAACSPCVLRWWTCGERTSKEATSRAASTSKPRRSARSRSSSWTESFQLAQPILFFVAKPSPLGFRPPIFPSDGPLKIHRCHLLDFSVTNSDGTQTRLQLHSCNVACGGWHDWPHWPHPNGAPAPSSRACRCARWRS